MHRLTPLLAGLLLFAPASYAQVEPGQTFTGKVTSVIDGDTYEVDRPAGPVVKVRLWGVDAPEFDQPYGAQGDHSRPDPPFWFSIAITSAIRR